MPHALICLMICLIVKIGQTKLNPCEPAKCISLHPLQYSSAALPEAFICVEHGELYQNYSCLGDQYNMNTKFVMTILVPTEDFRL